MTIVTLGTVVAPFSVRQETIAAVVPPCESKRLYAQECILCGATTGFFAIARGDWGEAARENRFAIPLFAAFSLNGAGAAAYFVTRRRARYKETD